MHANVENKNSNFYMASNFSHDLIATSHSIKLKIDGRSTTARVKNSNFFLAKLFQYHVLSVGK
jgi:hypothetical protein